MSAHTPTLRALVVDDDPAWQQILSELLTDAGLTVDIASSAEMAAAAMRRTPHRIAVVDLSLSGPDHRNQDGLTVLDAVRRQDPGCTPLLLTGFATVELAVSALKEYGAYTCLRKETFRRAQFRQLVSEMLATPPAPLVAMPDAASSLSGNGEASPARVLVVEDDAGWRDILSELLTDAGYSVTLSSSYGEALGHLRRKGYALAVIDLSLAGSYLGGNTDGLRLLEAARTLHVAALVVSGSATPSDVERVYAEFGVFGFMHKQAFDRAAFCKLAADALAMQRAADPTQRLSDREREVLDLLVLGLTNKEIAERLFISPNTVKRHVKAIFSKFEVNTRSAAVAKAVGEM